MSLAPIRRLAFAALALGAPFVVATAHAGACATNLPATMHAVRLHAFGGPENLKYDTVERPVADEGEVLVEVVAASINPIDWKLRERGRGSLAVPRVPGFDIAGRIVAVGDGVRDWRCGDAVVAYLEHSRPGGYAEYAAVNVRDLARKPENVSYAEGAAFPLVAMTAWDALERQAKVQAGERVLVQGGAGGVGSIGVQLAKARGAYVIATASARNAGYLRDIGVDEAIDYASVRFEDAVRDVDVVFDTVGGETLARSVAVVRRGGRLVTVAGRLPTSACSDAGIRCLNGNADGDPQALQAIADLVAQGKIRVNVDARFPLAQAAAAQEQNRAGHTRGKIVLQVRPEPGVAAKTP